MSSYNSSLMCLWKACRVCGHVFVCIYVAFFYEFSILFWDFSGVFCLSYYSLFPQANLIFSLIAVIVLSSLCSICFICVLGAVVAVFICYLDLQLHITIIESLCGPCVRHQVIQFVMDLPQVRGFLRVLHFLHQYN